ncbi:hypothetical protein FA15DRAFT_454849 [Coprinopsis marcescibilis]|uniref:Thioesterase domain-containing protein n=1 Tax=Coprinopsis marcescibilis TaxID=230819 RepID=A0A5C3L825_COPMA|nr:hypothetical protein FA15DRAFT_454849 [Coprinopsis marcescibilis]
MVHIPQHYSDKIPEVDISNTKGNASDETKRFCWGMFKYFVNAPHWFSSRIGHSIQLVEVNVWNLDGKDEDRPASAETVFEVEVTEDMCNLFGILHGACAAYLIDHCSVSSLVALGYNTGKDGTGLSQSMNIIWNEAAPLGTKLRIVNSSMIIRGRVRTCRTELWNGNRLCVTGVHSLVNAPDKMQKPGCNVEESKRPVAGPSQGSSYSPLPRETIFAAKL